MKKHLWGEVGFCAYLHSFIRSQRAVKPPIPCLESLDDVRSVINLLFALGNERLAFTNPNNLCLY